jgi:hypothetical protein
MPGLLGHAFPALFRIRVELYAVNLGWLESICQGCSGLKGRLRQIAKAVPA